MSITTLNHNHGNVFLMRILILITILISTIIILQFSGTSETIKIPATYVLEQTISVKDRCAYYECYYIKVPGYNYCSKHLKKKIKRNRK